MFGKPIFKNYSGFFNLFSRVMDPLLVAVAGYIAFLVKFSQNIDPIFKEYGILIAFVSLCVSIIFPMFGLYASWRGQSLFKQAKKILLAWSSVVLVIIVLLFSLKMSSGFSRLWLGYWLLIGLSLLLFVRISIYAFLHYQRINGRNIRRVVVVGGGELGQKIIRTAEKSDWMGYRVVAVFDDAESNEIDVQGTLDDVDVYLSKNIVDEIWLALPLRAELRVKELLTNIGHHAINIKYIPDIFGFSLLHYSMTEIAGVPAMNLSATPIYGGNRFVKELEDRLFASIILLLISPLMLIIACGVKLSSPGPVFFMQERVSWNGKRFNMYKFRTMPVNDDLVSQWGNVKSKKITNFGRMLRRSSLDELPQFINVVIGSMSIVGPRPERTQFVDKFRYEIPGYMQKHMVKAGITGWAQINGWRGDTCLKTRIEHDLYYIENWSLWFDLKIIFLTFFKGFLNKNAG